jgi:glycerol-3-phosphate dehydrogenase
LQTQVLIIGGGATGTGIARDLALRGVDCILVENKDINAGASGANHGLLHSGARYVASDAETAFECKQEGDLLKKLAPQCVEDTGGLFVGVEGDDENYIADFPNLCARAGIPCRPVDVKDALEIEDALSPNLVAAYTVEDASIDPFRLSLENIAQAIVLGARLRCHTRVTAFEKSGRNISAVHVINQKSGEVDIIEAEQVVNATGVWAATVAAMAGANLELIYSKGSLLISDNRLTGRVINRLRQSSDGDILVPGGTVSLLGTTSIRIETLDQIRPTIPEIDAILREGAGMIPALKTTRFIRSYAGVRPLIGSGKDGDDRSVSRSFMLLDHEPDQLDNLVTITGGKLTTYRLMAEKTADLVCARLGVDKPCLTRALSLPPTDAFRWTEPGLAPRVWMKAGSPGDLLLCECEMVPKSTIDQIIGALHDQENVPDLKAIGLRSRIGKGTCQGAFCGIRILAHMYDRGELSAQQGLKDLKTFLNGRWKGIRPVLWDTALGQEELQEALHCGLFGLELPQNY